MKYNPFIKKNGRYFMQYKKDIVKKKLLSAGEDEFFEYGFEGSSIRRIVKNAGTTIGNFYNYFKNKEELFKEVVGDEMDGFNEFITGHPGNEEHDYLWDEADPSVWVRALSDQTDIFISVFNRKFYILAACSTGTEFDSSRDKMIGYIRNHLMGHVVERGKNIPELEKTADVLANQFLDGILYILKNNSCEKTVEDLVRNHMLFFFMGMLGLTEGGSDD